MLETFRPTAAIALLLAAPVAHATPNLLTNGSFETPSIAGTSYVTFASGSTAITGWTAVGPGETQLTRTEFLPAAHGLQWVDLTGIVGYDKGLRSDPVGTTVGQRYTLSFDLGDYGAAGFLTSTVSVRINGGPATLFTNVYEGGVMDWERMSMDWVADSASAQVTIIGVANGALSNNWGIGLDNVVFQAAAVPEPASWALLLGGAGLLGLRLRRPAGERAGAAG